MCALCDQEHESTAYLCLHCCYAREVWFMVWTTSSIPLPDDQGEAVEDWWLVVLSHNQRRSTEAIIRYT
ncbi:hypothetical protein BAE44_0001871 [Dichanthelium oligosanthes]|uniref:Reverse transcriptase zinc-binding domain-containing protein n=1 Tax=Dichanthelium oligosanthes TaxID=888268 RepID=A0A1E5WIA5_9POAL|nr:hypothetical protein BAE44_0001871 [Dichanthelium oligosanthes]